MPIQSTVPGVLSALVALWTPLLPAGVAISLGPTPGGDIPADYVTVGWADDSMPGVTGTSRPTELGNLGQQAAEEYGVWCAVSTSSGDELAAARMARTDSVFQALVAAVRGNRTLSGVLLAPGMADLGTFQWQLESGGAVATVYFQIEVNAGLVM
jgi:hypothetical protein